MSNEFELINWNSQDDQVNHLPEGFPHAVTPPKYFIGCRCRWIPMTTTDWGTIVGQVFAPIDMNQSDLPQWGWLYLVFLDVDSPSRSWVVTEWAEEEDIELL
ncbi:MAG: hypothetical protein HC879_05975 [Leptolyngbyaceae cyanobacterium SL_5_9]|nr:hypothetical protein [Leptolyngbyaceae cyanobacterium SL_5_9]